MKRTVVLVDGGFLRSQTHEARKTYDVPFIQKFSLSCLAKDEECLRILYYDCAPYMGTATLPISGGTKSFGKPGNDQWLHDIAALDLFAVRRGVLKFRGFVRKKYLGSTTRVATAPTDADFEPRFEQKGVDMRIGLDIAAYSAEHLADRIILITNDTDCVPAMKFARKAGLQTVLIEVPNCVPTPELVAHTDFKRPIKWP